MAHKEQNHHPHDRYIDRRAAVRYFPGRGSMTEDQERVVKKMKGVL